MKLSKPDELPPPIKRLKRSMLRCTWYDECPGTERRE